MSEAKSRPKYCPLCGQENRCGIGEPQKACWCTYAYFPKEIFAMVPPAQLGKSCICKECLEKFVKEDPIDIDTSL
ncbi:hypothetical protein JOD24_002469 [Kroppenstedtia sanguinis]